MLLIEAKNAVVCNLAADPIVISTEMQIPPDLGILDHSGCSLIFVPFSETFVLFSSTIRTYE